VKFAQIGWRNKLESSTLQTPSPKFRPFLQKNGGIREIILHFFSRFSGFSAFFQSQAIAFQWHGPIQPLQKKSCLKTYHRFSVRCGLCHNRRMEVENNNPMTRQEAEIWGQKHGLLLSFCPHLSAFYLRVRAANVEGRQPRRHQRRKMRPNPGKSDLKKNISAHEK
jgi:hypothetical protein